MSGERNLLFPLFSHMLRIYGIHTTKNMSLVVLSPSFSLLPCFHPLLSLVARRSPPPRRCTSAAALLLHSLSSLITFTLLATDTCSIEDLSLSRPVEGNLFILSLRYQDFCSYYLCLHYEGDAAAC